MPTQELNSKKAGKEKKTSELQQLPLIRQSEEEKFPCRAEYMILDDHIILNVIVKNNSGEDVVFIDHPDHKYVDILAENREKDEAVGIPLVTYMPAQMDRLKRIKDGEEITFSDWIEFKKERYGVLRIYHDYEGYMRIWDKKLTVDFSY